MEFKFNIVEKIGTISTNESGWSRELNIVSWNGKAPKFDIRDWNEAHDKMSKGITFSDDQMRALYELLKERYEK